MNYKDVGKTLWGDGNVLYPDFGGLHLLKFIEMHTSSGYILFYVNYKVL